MGDLTSYELGIRKLNGILRVNEAEKNFIKKQKIILWLGYPVKITVTVV